MSGGGSGGGRGVCGEAYRVQVEDDLPRRRLHLLHQLVGQQAVRRQAEAAQQTHLHDGHARGVQAQTLHQTGRRQDDGLKKRIWCPEVGGDITFHTLLSRPLLASEITLHHQWTIFLSHIDLNQLIQMILKTATIIIIIMNNSNNNNNK